MTTVLQLVKDVIVERLGIDEPGDIEPQSTLKEDLKANSLDMVELIMAFEEMLERLGIADNNISDEQAAELKTVQAIVDELKRRGIKDE